MDILPVLESGGNYESADPKLGVKGSVPGKREWDYISKDSYDKSPPYLEHGPTLVWDYERLFEDDLKECDDVEMRWKTLLYARRMREITNLAQNAQEKGLTGIVDSYNRMARVGKHLKPYFTTDRGQEEDLDKVSSSD